MSRGKPRPAARRAGGLGPVQAGRLQGVALLQSLAQRQADLELTMRDAVADAIEGGFTWREVADALGAPVTTVHRRYASGIARHAGETE